MMPECTPQKDNLAFRGEDFKVNSVQEIPFGFRLIRAGEQITRRAIAFWLWLARFWHFSQPFSFAVLVGVPPICSTRGKTGILTLTREADHYVVGRTVEVRGSGDRSAGNFAKAKPSRAAHRAGSQPVGGTGDTRESPLPAEYRFRPRVARPSIERGLPATALSRVRSRPVVGSPAS